ncbi:MAG: polyphosphate polymerase domain-containing protein [Flavobacteriales bacterium]|nr:polyphosphate polymerase domain-containing protein [Flavobacteriales bacterium]
MSSFAPIIARFDPISLAEMDGVKLQDRVDTKYVFGGHELPDVLEAMLPHYRLLEVGGVRGTDYRSLYFDTPDLQHYKAHHDQRTFRSKVRFREYLGSDLVFLEVKRKTGRGRTDKKRMRVDAIPSTFTPEQQAFVARASRSDAPLQATLWNYFTRYTFVSRTSPERLTMDIALRYTADDADRRLGDVVIAELKQERADRTSPFVRIMRQRVIAASGMSKYCVGLLLLGRNVKHNAFKAVLLKLDKIRQAA